jgi:undecaprenyl diphosphate synthase
MVRGIRKIAAKAAAGQISPDQIDEEMFSDSLDTAGLPDPDLLIRTCGEERISNFLMWQIAYSELYFTPVAWPDFNKAELEKAVDAYNNRERRFGGLVN